MVGPEVQMKVPLFTISLSLALTNIFFFFTLNGQLWEDILIISPFQSSL